MSNWKRITLMVFVLIGGVAFFGYWSVNQFDNALDNLSAAYIANTPSVYSSLKINKEQIPTNLPEISTVLATLTNPEISFISPQEGERIYIGCTYPISWQSSTTISSLVTDLVDAVTGETYNAIESGLEEENIIEKDSQNINWKVGNVLPGEYHIKISNINGFASDFISGIFEINKMPTSISTKEQINICEESGGSF